MSIIRAVLTLVVMHNNNGNDVYLFYLFIIRFDIMNKHLHKKTAAIKTAVIIRSHAHFLIVCGAYFLCRSLHYRYAVIKPQCLVTELFNRFHIMRNIQQWSAVLKHILHTFRTLLLEADSAYRENFVCDKYIGLYRCRYRETEPCFHTR